MNRIESSTSGKDSDMQNVGQIMQRPKYESALNTWLAAALRERQLDANEESAQGGGIFVG